MDIAKTNVSDRRTGEPTSAEKMHALPWALSAQTGMSIYSSLIMAGPVFLLFLNSLGLKKTQIGIVLSIIPFLGVLSPFLTHIQKRFGYKKSFLFTSVICVLVLSSLIATPWILIQQGGRGAYLFVILVMLIFAFFQASGTCSLTPWMHEFIPDKVRGKFAAISNVTGVLVSSATVALAGVYLGDEATLSRFVTLFIIAVVIGLVSVIFYSHVPGGKVVVKTKERVGKEIFLDVIKDRDFTRFLIGSAFVTLAWVPVAPGGFLTLYLADAVKLDPAKITLCASIIMVAGIFTSYFWGWAADRYGSKPIMLICLGGMWIFPLFLCLLPPSSKYAFYAIIGVGVVIGMVMPGWGISYSRYVYVNLIPTDRRGQYTSVQLAFEGLTGGITPVLIGIILSKTSGINIVSGWIEVGQYTPIFATSFILIAAAMIVLNGLPSDAKVSTAQFAGMFLTGNPATAMYGMYSYSRGGSEQKRMLAMRRFGRARSPLATKELLESLNDPSPNVRIQTIIAITSARPNKNLVDALIEIVRKERLDLCTAAAWALGLIGDPHAIPILRESLHSKHSLLRSRAAISLARLNDVDSIPMLLEQFNKDEILKSAYADALGVLKCEDAIVPIINYMSEIEDQVTRQSLAYSVASIVGNENMFLLMLRQARRNLPDAREELIYHIRKRLPSITEDPKKVRELVDKIQFYINEQDYSNIAKTLSEIIELVPENRLSQQAWTVIKYALPLYTKGSSEFKEFAMLTVHSLLA